MCRRLFRHSCKVCLLFSAATVFNLAESHFPYVLAKRVNLFIGRFMPLFCLAMAWSSPHAGLRSLVLYVSEWRPSRRVDQKERSCSFLERDNQKVSCTVNVTLLALLIWRAFFLYLLRSTALLQNGHQGVLKATFDYKNPPFWAYLRWDRQNSTAKMFCLSFLMCVPNIFAHVVEMAQK